jgi:hypothetical protein
MGRKRRGFPNKRTLGRNPQQWGLAVNSPWNIPIHNSATYLAPSGSNQTVNLRGIGTHTPSINRASFSITVYYAQATDPLWTVTVHAANWDPNWSFADYTVNVRIPAGATPSVGEPVWVIMDPDGVHWHEMFFVDNVVDSVSCRTGFYHYNDGTYNGLATGINPQDATGPRAYHGSMIGGLIRGYDETQGVIKHALAISCSTDQLLVTGGTESLCTGWVWPAYAQDSTSCSTNLYTGLNPVGTLAAIPPSVNVETDLGISTAAGKMVAHAAQDYGVYIVDRCGSPFTLFYGEFPGLSSTWTSQFLSNYGPDRVIHALQVVTNNTASTPGGGAYDGTATNRRAALATAF